MLLREGLTKENFFNEMYKKFPEATKLFCNWIDDYKKAVGWDVLFGNIFPTEKKIKFHDIPYDMQAGIWNRFAQDTLNNLFEQPDYIYSGDLESDIETVFKEIDDEIIIKLTVQDEENA